MADHGIHHRGRLAAVVDRSVGNAGGDPHHHRFVLPQGDSLEASVLEHHQIKPTAQQDELVGLVTMAKQLPGCPGASSAIRVSWLVWASQKVVRPALTRSSRRISTRRDWAMAATDAEFIKTDDSDRQRADCLLQNASVVRDPWVALPMPIRPSPCRRIRGEERWKRAVLDSNQRPCD